MSRRTRRRSDPERGERLSLDELAREAQSETLERRSEHDTGEKVMVNSPDGSSRPEAQGERKDFDDGANPLWLLHDKEVQAHDDALFQGLLADMTGVPTFAGLFAAVITSFLVDSLKNLQPDPAQQSVYYQQQSVAMLAQISQQLASIAPQVSVPSTPPPPYPVFHPSSKDIAVNILWVAGLIYSLSAALFATHVQEWVRTYLRGIQRYGHPLKRARFRLSFFNRTKSVWMLSKFTTGAIRNSLTLFFLGQAISLFEVNTTIGAVMTAFVCYSLSLSIYFGSKQGNTLGLGVSLTLMEARHKQDMEEPDRRKGHDVRTIRWLINRTAANAEMEPLLLAIPGSFNTEWGKDVWREVSREVSTQAPTSEPPTGHPPAGRQVSPSPPPPEGVTADKVSQSVKYLFDTCNHHSYFENDEARHRRMRGCVEATSSLVCLIDYRLDRFGEIGKVVSEIGHIEDINRSLTTSSDTSFVIRWTCLSLVDIQQTLGRNRLQAPAAHAVNELARFQPEHGQPDETGREGAQRIDECLKAAWEHVEDLRRAFEPWTEERTTEQIEEILLTHEQQISDLERLKSEADGMADVDREISVYQDAMDDATHRLTRQLPGVSFDEPHRSKSFLIYDVFNTPTTGGSAPVPPQLIFPGQKLQALARFGQKLRAVLDHEPRHMWYDEMCAELEFVDQVPVSLRWPDGLMRRQLWRLQDVRDGRGLGFTVELFFLSLRRLLSISSLDGSNSVFYTGTFKIITSRWEESKESVGTHRVFLNIICDLIIRGRGTFSDFSCPGFITAMLLDVVSKMLQGYTGPDEHIRDAVREIESANPDEDIPDGVQEIEDPDPIRTDRRELQRKALEAFPRFRSNP